MQGSNETGDADLPKFKKGSLLPHDLDQAFRNSACYEYIQGFLTACMWKAFVTSFSSPHENEPIFIHREIRVNKMLTHHQELCH